VWEMEKAPASEGGRYMVAGWKPALPRGQAGMLVLHQKKESLTVRYFLGFLRNSVRKVRSSAEAAARLS
jgi:hypothetical protein